MTRKLWDVRKRKMCANAKVTQFLGEVDEVCQKYKMAIGHEDSGGSFVICPYTSSRSRWLQAASWDSVPLWR